MFKMVNLSPFYARFLGSSVIYTDKQSEFAKMKVKNLIYKIGIMVWGMMLFIACSNDSSDDGGANIDITPSARTETWMVTIEPEFVLADADKPAHRVAPVKEAVNDKGERVATFDSLAVNNVVLKEGWRYKLKIAANLSVDDLGSSAYTFTSMKIEDMAYVGIKKDNMKEVVMDVTPIRVLPKNSEETWSYETLCGQVVDSDEKIDMMMGEINGLDYKEFYGKDNLYRIRIVASITPSSKPIYEGKQQRVRLVKVVRKSIIEKDSIVYADASGMNVDPAPSVSNSQYGDFEMVWSANGKEIGKGILHAELNNTSTFGLFMDAENNMTKFFVDSIFKKDFKTMEPQKVTVEKDGVTYNAYLQYAYVGYSSDSYYYNIKNWQYTAIAKIDDMFYQFTPIPDYEKSSMSYDTKAKQWMGVITIKQVDLCEAYRIPPPWTEKYVMSPPLKIVFSTTKKIK